MPRQRKGIRLWLRPERRAEGKLHSRATWIIIDGPRHIGTGCAADEVAGAEECLAAYIASKYRPKRKERDIEEIDIADVLSIYYDDCRERQGNRKKLDERIARLNEFWGGKTLSEVNGETCRAYAKARRTPGGAR